MFVRSSYVFTCLPVLDVRVLMRSSMYLSICLSLLDVRVLMRSSYVFVSPFIWVGCAGRSVCLSVYLGLMCREKFLPEAGLESWEWVLILTVPFALTALLNDVSFLGRISSLGILAGEAFAITLLVTAAAGAQQRPLS